MNKKKLMRMVAVCVACLGMGTFMLSGCKNAPGDNTGDNTQIGGNTGGGNTDDKTDDKDDNKDNPTKPDENPDDNKGDNNGDDGNKEEKPDDNTGDKEENPEQKPDEPVITGPVKGGPIITKASNEELETAYVTWEAADNAKWYNVYYSVKDADSWVKLDAPLVREYKKDNGTYFRADAVGLKAGSYDMKVVPVSADGEEATEYVSTAKSITVKPHERAGYAFHKGNASGAYNDDGTLKANASVIYVTDATKDTVTLNGVKGLQNILDAQKKAGKPLAVRLIGNVTSPDISESKANNNNKTENTVLIKGDGKGTEMCLTFEGIGSDATANGWTLRITSSTNVEVRNIGFMNTHAGEPDDITLEKDDHIWVHNCDLFYGGAGGDSDQAKGDGALDTKESSFITHSYNHFWDSGKCNLQNMHESGDWRITYHHNWYDHSDSRHPRIRSATVHIYNNYFDGNAKYGVGACEGANAFVENNYFRSTVGLKPMMSSKQGTDLKNAEGGNPDKGTFSKEDGGMIKAFGNMFDCPMGKLQLITQNDTDDKTNLDCYLATSRNETVPAEYKTKYGGTSYSNFDTASDMYEYTVDSAEVAKQKVERYAGRVDGGDMKWDFDDATEDGNSSIITAFKAALTAYKTSLLKVDGETVTSGNGGSTGGGTGDETPDTPPAAIEGEISFIPTASGSGFTVEGTTKSHSAITVGGVDIPKNSGLKLNSSGKVTFTLTEEMTLTLYLGVGEKGVKVDGNSQTLTSAGNCYTVSIKLAAGEHTITQGNGENTLYLIKLAPVA